MPKILGDSGKSLGDAYDIEGSQIAIKNLNSEEGVTLVHEMGHTMFAERLFARILMWDSGLLNQSTSFYARSTQAGWAAGATAPAVPVRVYGCLAFIDVGDGWATHVTRCAILAHIVDDGTGEGQDFPVWVWNGTGNSTIRMQSSAATAVPQVGDADPSQGVFPSPFLLQGGNRASQVDELVLSGTTAAFGAGTTRITAKALIASPDPAGLSSLGVPIPSW